jgi:hypothetical protein
MLVSPLTVAVLISACVYNAVNGVQTGMQSSQSMEERYMVELTEATRCSSPPGASAVTVACLALAVTGITW